MNHVPDIPRIETRRLLLTLPLAEDAPRMLRFMEENRQHLAPWDPARPVEHYTVGFWSRYLAAMVEAYRAGESMRLVLLERSAPDGEIIGVCNFSNIIRGAFQCAILGYSLDHRYEGKGMMYEALSAAIPYVFEHLNLHRISANYIPTNQRSGNLLRRLGFTVEGYARDYLLIAGRWQDHILTSLTNSDWESR
jgi:ribosomal-protein-alanine N-acetyltransferase